MKKEKEEVKVTSPHQWVRCAATPSGTDEDDHGSHQRKPDAVLLRADRNRPYDSIEKKQKRQREAEPPLRRDVLALCGFMFETKRKGKALKRKSMLCDLADILASQPWRGCVPGFLFFCGNDNMTVPTTPRTPASDAARQAEATKQPCSVEFLVLDRECIRSAIIDDCFGVGFSQLITVLGVFSLCDEEMLTFFPAFDRIADAADQPNKKAKLLENADEADQKEETAQKERETDIDSTGKKLSPPPKRPVLTVRVYKYSPSQATHDSEGEVTVLCGDRLTERSHTLGRTTTVHLACRENTIEPIAAATKAPETSDVSKPSCSARFKHAPLSERASMHDSKRLHRV